MNKESHVPQILIVKMPYREVCFLLGCISIGRMLPFPDDILGPVEMSQGLPKKEDDVGRRRLMGWFV